MADSKSRRILEAQAEDSGFQKLLHGIYEAILITDTSGAICEANARAARMFDRERSELCELTISDLVSGFDERVFGNVTSALDKKTHIILNAYCDRGDGTSFPVEIAVRRIHLTDEGEICLSIRDVTVRKETERKLVEAHEELLEAEQVQARIDTITTLAHEINNPLQMLMSMVELDKNVKYSVPLKRITTVMKALRDQVDIESVDYLSGGDSRRFKIPTSDAKGASGADILLVDDEDALRRLLSQILELEFPDLRVETAANGSEAVEAFKENHHAIIVLDLMMPVMNGEEAFRAIQMFCEESSWEKPAMVFCTGFTVPPSIRQALQSEQMHCLLPKPVHKATFVDVIGQLLDARSLAGGND